MTSKMDSDALKERNYRQVELIRQLNAREQKRLQHNKQGINTRCRMQLDHVKEEQKRIVQELKVVRNSTTKTWGFLPPRRGGSNSLQPPTGLDQFQMEEYARQLYNIRPKKPHDPLGNDYNGSPTTKRKAPHINIISGVNEEEEDEDLDDIDGAKPPANIKPSVAPRGNRSPRKKYRTSLNINLEQVQSSISARLANGQESNTTEQAAATKSSRRSTSLSDRSEKRTSKAGNEVRYYSKTSLDSSRSSSLPPVNRSGQRVVAWGNTITMGEQDNHQASHPSSPGRNTESNSRHSDNVTSKTPAPQNRTVKTDIRPITEPQSSKNTQSTQNKSQVSNKNSTPSKQNGGSSSNQNPLLPPPKSVTKNGAGKEELETSRSQPQRALTPIDESNEGQSKDRSSDKKHAYINTSKPAAAPQQTPQKKEAKPEKEDGHDASQAEKDAENYNPDGSLRTVHTLPDFQDSLREALKARYLRMRSKPTWEREMSVSECWTPQNLPWKKVKT